MPRGPRLGPGPREEREARNAAGKPPRNGRKIRIYQGRPWDRQVEESDGAYWAFIRYRDLGAGRSLTRLVELVTSMQESGEEVPVGAAPGNLRQISGWYRWVDRCRAWDTFLQRQRDKVAAREAGKWEARRQKLLEQAWQDGEQLREKVQKMLAFPVKRERIDPKDKDGKTIIVEPMKWKFADTAAILRLATEIQTLVLEAVEKDVADMTDAEIGATEAAEGEVGGDQPG